MTLGCENEGASSRLVTADGDVLAGCGTGAGRCVAEVVVWAVIRIARGTIGEDASAATGVGEADEAVPCVPATIEQPAGAVGSDRPTLTVIAVDGVWRHAGRAVRRATSRRLFLAATATVATGGRWWRGRHVAVRGAVGSVLAVSRLAVAVATDVIHAVLRTGGVRFTIGRLADPVSADVVRFIVSAGHGESAAQQSYHHQTHTESSHCQPSWYSALPEARAGFALKRGKSLKRILSLIAGKVNTWRFTICKITVEYG